MSTRDNKQPRPPPERERTIRQAIREHLEQDPLTARELSSLVGIREKDVIAHLEHLSKSLRGSGRSLVVEPAECLSCGFVFKKRRRLSRPGSCPACRKPRIEPPVFRVE